MKLFARIGAAIPIILVADFAFAHGEEVIFRPVTLSVIVLGVVFGAWASARRARLRVAFGQAVALQVVGLVAYFTLSQGWSLEAFVLFGFLALFLGLLPLAAVFFATYAGLRLLSKLFRFGPRKSTTTTHEP